MDLFLNTLVLWVPCLVIVAIVFRFKAARSKSEADTSEDNTLRVEGSKGQVVVAVLASSLFLAFLFAAILTFVFSGVNLVKDIAALIQ